LENQNECECVIDSLRLHYFIVLILYIIALVVAWNIIGNTTSPSKTSDINNLLLALITSGSILATFGSALSAIGLIWHGDLIERIRLNVDIFYKDIVTADHWRRWPFLSRHGNIAVKNGDTLRFNLKNPPVVLDAYYQTIEVALPVISYDFYDLSVLQNFRILHKHRESAVFLYAMTGKLEKNAKTNRTPRDEYMAYECMYDIWLSGIKLRASRYVIHFGAGLTIMGALVVFALYLTKLT
jgi:hypothetical protein